MDNVDNFVDNSLFRPFHHFQMWITFRLVLKFGLFFFGLYSKFVQIVDLKLFFEAIFSKTLSENIVLMFK